MSATQATWKIKKSESYQQQSNLLITLWLLFHIPRLYPWIVIRVSPSSPWIILKLAWRLWTFNHTSSLPIWVREETLFEHFSAKISYDQFFLVLWRCYLLHHKECNRSDLESYLMCLIVWKPSPWKMVFILGNVLENEVLVLELFLKISLVKLSFLFFMLGKRKNLKRRRRKKKRKQMAKKLMKAHHRIIQWQGMIEIIIVVVCTCIFTMIACACWCHMQTTKRLPYLYTVLVLKLEEWAFYFQLIALCG